MAKSKLMSLRAYARHRGVNLSAVQKAIKTGRIAPDPKTGKLDPEICDLAWEQATDPSKQRKADQDPSDPKKRKVVPRKVIKNAERFAEARAGAEDYKAKLLQLKFEIQAKKLVDADVVKKRAFESARTLREALLNLPNQMANDLASETDPVKCANMLTVELVRLLDELAAPRVAAAQAGLSSLGLDPALPAEGSGAGDPEDEEDPELELEGLPVEAPR
jgi:hypothetical protein